MFNKIINYLIYRPILLSLVMSLNLFYVQSQNKYTVQCILRGAKGSKLYLSNRGLGTGPEFKETLHDSAIATSDTVIFNGHFSELSNYDVHLKSVPVGDWRTFIIDTGNIVIEGHVDSLWNASVSNSPQNRWAKSMLKVISLLGAERVCLQDSFHYYDNLNDTILANHYAQKMNEYAIKENKNILNLCLRFPQCYYSLMYLQVMLASGETSPKEASYHLDRLDTIALRSAYLDLFRKHIAEDMFSKLRSKLEIESLKDLKGQSGNLLSTNGQTLVLDFWASWCVPCIAKLPELKKIISQYKNSNVKFVSISLDTDQDRWKQSVAKNKIYWSNYRMNNGFDSDAAVRYGIYSIPYLIVVGEDNKVEMLNPSLLELEKYLQRQLN